MKTFIVISCIVIFIFDIVLRLLTRYVYLKQLERVHMVILLIMISVTDNKNREDAYLLLDELDILIKSIEMSKKLLSRKKLKEFAINANIINEKLRNCNPNFAKSVAKNDFVKSILKNKID